MKKRNNEKEISSDRNSLSNSRVSQSSGMFWNNLGVSIRRDSIDVVNHFFMRESNETGTIDSFTWNFFDYVIC